MHTASKAPDASPRYSPFSFAASAAASPPKKAAAQAAAVVISGREPWGSTPALAIMNAIIASPGGKEYGSDKFHKKDLTAQVCTIL